jgi:hypothetical protein
MIIFPQLSLASLHEAAEKWKSLIRNPGWPMKWQSPIFVMPVLCETVLPSAFRSSTEFILELTRTANITPDLPSRTHHEMFCLAQDKEATECHVFGAAR